MQPDVWDLCSAIQLIATDDSVIEVSTLMGAPAILYIRHGRNPADIPLLSSVQDMGFLWTPIGSEWLWYLTVGLYENQSKDRGD